MMTTSTPTIAPIASLPTDSLVPGSAFKVFKHNSNAAMHRGILTRSIPMRSTNFYESTYILCTTVIPIYVNNISHL